MQLLFSDSDLSLVLDATLREAAEAVLKWNEDQLLSQSPTEIANYLVDKYSVECPVIDEENIESDEPLDTFDSFLGSRGTVKVPATRVVIHVPFSGEKGLFSCRPNTFTMNPPRAQVGEGELVLEFQPQQFDGAQIRQQVDRAVVEIQQWLVWCRGMTDDHNQRLRPAIEGAIQTRRQRLLDNRSQATALGLKIRHRGGAPTVAIPTIRKTLRITAPKPAAVGVAFQPEPALADADYEEAIRLITASGRELERMPTTAAKLNEEERRNMMLVALNSSLEGEAGGEMFNGSGKTDILVRVGDRNVFVGECKIWRGEASFAAAIDQLLSYLVWRDTKAALILFIGKVNATAIIEKAASALADHPRCLRTVDSSEPLVRRNYIFMGDQDAGREVRLAFLPFVMRAASKDSASA